MTTLQHASPAARRRRASRRHPALALFAVMWALAALWHLLGNTFVGSSWSHGAAGGRRSGWCCGGRARWGRSALLAVTSLVTVWEEAPVLGNHWLLVGFVDLVILMAAAAAAPPAALGRAARPRQPGVPGRPPVPARASTSSPSFAKLNAGFFDRSVSCAVYYFDESTDSVGLDAPAARRGGLAAVGRDRRHRGGRAVDPDPADRAPDPPPRRGARARVPRRARHRPHPISSSTSRRCWRRCSCSSSRRRRGSGWPSGSGSVRARLALARRAPAPARARRRSPSCPRRWVCVVAVDAVDARTALDLGLVALARCTRSSASSRRVRYLRQRRPEPEPGALRPAPRACSSSSRCWWSPTGSRRTSR